MKQSGVFGAYVIVEEGGQNDSTVHLQSSSGHGITYTVADSSDILHEIGWNGM
jgi:hypothetical protein